MFLVPYLPYKLQVKSIDIFENDPIFEMTIKEGGRRNATIDWVLRERENFRPILRPLSDIDKEIELNGNKFIPLEVLNNMLFTKHSKLEHCKGSLLFSTNISGFNLLSMNEKIQKLYEWHFDVNGLINDGLAISIHDVV
jgi:hypothetical protein